MKIQKEYPDQDSFEVFKSKTPEFLEDTIFMKKKGDSDDEESSNSKSIIRPHIPTPKAQEVCEIKNDENFDFSESMAQILKRKRGEIAPDLASVPVQALIHQNVQTSNDLLSIKAFFDHVQNSLTGSFVRNQGGTRYTSNEGKLKLF